jgi:hypothetical protein
VRKAAALSLLAVTVLLVAVAPGDSWAHGFRHRPGIRSHVFIGVRPSFWWGPPWYHSPYYYPPPYYVYSPPVVVQEQPSVYIQQGPTPPPPPPAPEAYWYYCGSAKGYYPTVPTCPEAWIKVPPRTE